MQILASSNDVSAGEFGRQSAQHVPVVFECQIFRQLLQGEKPRVHGIIGGPHHARNCDREVNHQIDQLVWTAWCEVKAGRLAPVDAPQLAMRTLLNGLGAAQ